MSRILFDATMQGLAEAMTLHQRRHEVLVSNLANVETPGFRAQELDFETALKDAFVTEWLAKLSANGGRYVALAKLLGHRISLLRQAIEGTK